TPAEVNPYFMPQADSIEIEIKTDAEADEFWSYVGRKKNQRRTWYAVERKAGVILAWHNGRRADESCSRLMAKLAAFPATRYYTDDWQSCRKHVPSSKHIVGKADTWRIERRNLNFRTHIKRLNRKTVCFSKNEKIHDNVIGMYINRYYFQNGRYSENI
ncbi:IS1 family transposase, partial [Candidatus Electronema sp. JM]|uniref:IS1 family transposase n=1 Tax=Candidatus Electronema sp. JM TaxID=3401571 RepID=UPI003AA98561